MPTFDARQFARAWLSIAVASAKDLNPVLDRTVLVEVHDDGVRLTATDRRILLTAWVPTLEAWDAPEPELYAAPLLDTVATDIDGRAGSLLGYAMALTSDDAYDVGDVELDLVVDRHRPTGVPANGSLPMPDERRYVVLELPDVEKVWLRQIEQDYPSWRRMLDQHKPKSTQAVALEVDVLAKLAKLGKMHPGRPILWHFGGADKVARVSIAGQEANAPAEVYGLVMPTRWTFDEQEVLAEAEAAKAAASQAAAINAGGNDQGVAGTDG